LIPCHSTTDNRSWKIAYVSFLSSHTRDLEYVRTCEPFPVPQSMRTTRAHILQRIQEHSLHTLLRVHNNLGCFRGVAELG